MGYEFIEISPRGDFIPLFGHPRVDRSRIQSLKVNLERSGVQLSALYGLFRWTSLNEAARQAAVRYMTRTIEIARELGCSVVTGEFGPSASRPLESEAQFWRTVDDLLPVLEANDVVLRIEPHPDDFVENSNQAVDIVRGIESERIAYLYCVPHTYHMGDDIVEMVRYAAPVLQHIHVADVFHPKRYIVNPSDSTVRVHQHLDIGQGDIDWDAFFTVLREIGFDGTMSSCVTAWPDRPDESARNMLRSLNVYLAKYPASPLDGPSRTESDS